jgi:hypothetical protein
LTCGEPVLPSLLSRNELENARLRHAFRLAADPERHWTKDDLMRLEPSDILP